MKMVEDGDLKLKHLSGVVWKCPYCKNETVRYDITKNVFVCWECCKVIPEEEGHKMLDGFYSTMTAEERKRFFQH